MTKGSSTLFSGATAGATSPQVTLTAFVAAQLYYALTQVGTATTAASFQVQVQPAGSSAWYTLATYTMGTAAGAYQNVIDLPITAGKVQVVYTAQAGGTSSTLTMECGTVQEI